MRPSLASLGRAIHTLLFVLSLVFVASLSHIYAHETNIAILDREWKVKVVPVEPHVTTIPIGGVLGPSECDLYGQIYLDKGDTVHVVIYWNPGLATLVIGLLNIETGDCMYKSVIGGRATVTFEAWVTGSYYVFICNDSPYAVEYFGSITFE